MALVTTINTIKFLIEYKYLKKKLNENEDVRVEPTGSKLLELLYKIRTIFIIIKTIFLNENRWHDFIL